MKYRAGVIFLISGLLLLWKPDMRVDLAIEQCLLFFMEHWPLLFVLLGIFLLQPKKKKSKPRKS